jgi:polar amino acid transport system permease protein
MLSDAETVTSAVLSRPKERAPALWMMPHRVALIAISIVLIIASLVFLHWHWVPQYANMLARGVLTTVYLLLSSAVVGFVLAIGLGLVQLTGPRPLAWLANGFCGIIRGTPLLLQIWLLYYGSASLFAQHPEFRKEYPELFYYLRQSWPYAFLSLTLSFAAYEGEVMRGAFAGVPRGELQAAKAFGMSRWKAFRRIWLPRAIHRALPTLAGDMVGQMKSTPLVATITVVDVYGVIVKVRQDTYLTYEPLLLLSVIYLLMTGLIVLAFRYFESKIPVRT